MTLGRILPRVLTIPYSSNPDLDPSHVPDSDMSIRVICSISSTRDSLSAAVRALPVLLEVTDKEASYAGTWC